MGMPSRLRLACLAAAAVLAVRARAAAAALRSSSARPRTSPARRPSPVKETTLAAKAYFDQVNRAGGVNGRRDRAHLGRRRLRSEAHRGQRDARSSPRSTCSR